MNLNASIVWTEIYSYIKGSAHSHVFPNGALPFKEYTLMEQKNNFLSKSEKNHIYGIFQIYEKWKNNQSGYDLMDAVNHILQ